MRQFQKYYCMRCRASRWMREVLDANDSQKDGWICIVCSTIHRHPNLWKHPPKTLAED